MTEPGQPIPDEFLEQIAELIGHIEDDEETYAPFKDLDEWVQNEIFFRYPAGGKEKEQQT
jgi:hypothetical protein